MSVIDRRELIAFGLAGSAAIGVPASVQAAAPALSHFIFDGRFDAAIRSAGEWRQRGASIIDSRRIDLGTFWREVAAGHRAAQGVAGLTLWVDSFICETFGREHGWRIRRGTLDLGHGLTGWVLR